MRKTLFQKLPMGTSFTALHATAHADAPIQVGDNSILGHGLLPPFVRRQPFFETRIGSIVDDLNAVVVARHRIAERGVLGRCLVYLAEVRTQVRRAAMRIARPVVYQVVDRA